MRRLQGDRKTVINIPTISALLLAHVYQKPSFMDRFLLKLDPVPRWTIIFSLTDVPYMTMSSAHPLAVSLLILYLSRTRRSFLPEVQRPAVQRRSSVSGTRNSPFIRLL